MELHFLLPNFKRNWGCKNDRRGRKKRKSFLCSPNRISLIQCKEIINHIIEIMTLNQFNIYFIRVYCNKLKLTSLKGLIANILIANKERLNFVFNKKENKGELSGHFCPLLPCF